MAEALRLARLGLYTTTPNPRVGCVIVKDGAVVGSGWHAKAGEPHAEVHALREAGEQARGATAYVTLEPCNHTGRTGPCSEALIAAGVGRVVAAMQDPNPLVAGEGLARLAAAGVQVQSGLLESEAIELNIGFVSRMTRGRPWLRLKTATTLDGKTALNNNVSQWITGEAARQDGHRWRARACAILTGFGTVKEDNPQLTVRGVDYGDLEPRQPLRIVVDSRLQIYPTANVLRGGNALVVGAIEDPSRIAALRDVGADVLIIPNEQGKVELHGMLRALAERGINEIHGEAGFKLNGSLLREGCVDEFLIYQAPMLVGDSAQGMFNLQELTELSQATRLKIVERTIIGDDMRILARPLR
ncbi:MAG: bifunctional diaminohydroxyphosphoribosylaminopyrimidine deaminase/5-amino-6-(5-phosphoribosylamino)uracil reductase RibD [Rhodocyclaceae bacterium]|nr:bifunctional diaminohydroxyphosphoribosylaminopyrimidine deaminase/5-amino-6-(5-phosphoribosylamino)uracil reductase RibD [Rhodocyclaceae bacterium]